MCSGIGLADLVSLRLCQRVLNVQALRYAKAITSSELLMSPLIPSTPRVPKFGEISKYGPAQLLVMSLDFAKKFLLQTSEGFLADAQRFRLKGEMEFESWSRVTCNNTERS